MHTQIAIFLLKVCYANRQVLKYKHTFRLQIKFFKNITENANKTAKLVNLGNPLEKNNNRLYKKNKICYFDMELEGT